MTLCTLSSLVFSGILCLQASKSASLGGQQILDCLLHFPNNKPVTYLIEWNKNGLDSSVLSRFGDYPPTIHPKYQNRVRLVNDISLELSHIREFDQGWYECKVIFVDGIGNEDSNGTWIHLNVNSEYPMLCNILVNSRHFKKWKISLFHLKSFSQYVI